MRPLKCYKHNMYVRNLVSSWTRTEDRYGSSYCKLSILISGRSTMQWFCFAHLNVSWRIEGGVKYVTRYRFTSVADLTFSSWFGVNTERSRARYTDCLHVALILLILKFDVSKLGPLQFLMFPISVRDNILVHVTSQAKRCSLIRAPCLFLWLGCLLH